MSHEQNWFQAGIQALPCVEVAMPIDSVHFEIFMPSTVSNLREDINAYIYS